MIVLKRVVKTHLNVPIVSLVPRPSLRPAHVQEDKDCTIVTPRTTNAKLLAEESMDKFDSFVSKLQGYIGIKFKKNYFHDSRYSKVLHH